VIFTYIVCLIWKNSRSKPIKKRKNKE
jgi:hypothetical protein